MKRFEGSGLDVVQAEAASTLQDFPFLLVDACRAMTSSFPVCIHSADNRRGPVGALSFLYGFKAVGTLESKFLCEQGLIGMVQCSLQRSVSKL